MLDPLMRRLIDAPLNRAGQRLAARGISAAQVTLGGLAVGLVAAAVLALGGAGWIALLLLAVNRLCDGLDGAVARATSKTDFGGYLDIVSDFVIYGAVPLAFVLRDPANGAAGAFLLTSFYINGATFLGFAILAEKRGIKTTSQGQKSLYYSAGLLEGTETIGFFAAVCLWPWGFAAMAWGFGALTLMTAAARLLLARRVFGRDIAAGPQG